jgi:hypothetical protein
MRLQGIEGTGGSRILADSSKGRLLRFLFLPPALGPLPVRAGGFASRLARVPVDLVTSLGMARSNAYYAAGCPVELCDHAAARDLWRVIYQDAIGAKSEERRAKSGAPEGTAEHGEYTEGGTANLQSLPGGHYERKMR